jgi:hypothetical protein
MEGIINATITGHTICHLYVESKKVHFTENNSYQRLAGGRWKDGESRDVAQRVQSFRLKE